MEIHKTVPKQRLTTITVKVGFKKAYEYILKNDPGQDIAINVHHWKPGVLNLKILSPDDRSRLRYTDDLDEAKYFISNYHQHSEEYPYKDEFYSVRIDEAKVLAVYKLKR